MTTDRLADAKKAIESLRDATGNKAELIANGLKKEYDALEDEVKANLDILPWHNRTLWAIIGVVFIVGVAIGGIAF